MYYNDIEIGYTHDNLIYTQTHQKSLFYLKTCPDIRMQWNIGDQVLLLCILIIFHTSNISLDEAGLLGYDLGGEQAIDGGKLL